LPHRLLKNVPVPDAVANRVRARLMHGRMLRVFGRAGAIVLFSCAIGLLLVQTRDTQTQQRVLRLADAVAARFQAEFDARGVLTPMLTPDKVGPELAPRLDAFYFNPLYPHQSVTRPEVGVCSTQRPVPFFLRRNDWMVVTFDGRRFRPRWMTQEEFARRHDELGLNPGLVSR
jgi:hypothetical protein